MWVCLRAKPPQSSGHQHREGWEPPRRAACAGKAPGLLFRDSVSSRFKELAQEIDGLAFEADITSKQANVDLVNFTLENYGQIDLAVNHVGLATRGPIAQETEEHLQLMTEVNYFGTYWFIRAVADVMEEGGAIVTTSSLVAYDVSTGMSAYACAKAAAERFVEAAAVEYQPEETAHQLHHSIHQRYGDAA